MPTPPALKAAELLSRFLALDAFLVEHQALWRPRPFTHLQLPWEPQHTELAQWLRQRTLAQAESAQQAVHQLPAPAPYPQLASQAAALCEIGPLATHPVPAAPARLNVDVPGRKWQQIEAFASHLNTQQPHSHWLDWCAGKGHLGRRLLQPGQHLTCLEFDPALVQAGQALSEHHHLNADHRQQDVLADNAAEQLATHHTPVALHACGDLHVRLLQLATAAGCRTLAIAPCCYNRIAAGHYTHLSPAAQASTLQLDLHDLALPASEAVTAGTRVRRLRDQSMARRLAFDLLQRTLRGSDDYLPTPSLPTAWLDKPFATWCTDLATLKGLPAPGPQPWNSLEAAGQQRLAHVRNLELLRALFRRPLELWLALDRALLLADNGYHVTLGTFCPNTLTPRNLMLLAERP